MPLNIVYECFCGVFFFRLRTTKTQKIICLLAIQTIRKAKYFFGNFLAQYIQINISSSRSNTIQSYSSRAPQTMSLISLSLCSTARGPSPPQRNVHSNTNHNHLTRCYHTCALCDRICVSVCGRGVCFHFRRCRFVCGIVICLAFVWRRVTDWCIVKLTSVSVQ